MLNIKIVGVNPDNSLQFKVNGRGSDNGNGEAKKNWIVHWKVKRDIDVLSITEIQKKSSSPDIFTVHPPRAESSRKWKATVDSTAQDHTQYHYSILWKDANGNVHTHDPIISINPSLSFFSLTEVVLVAVTLALAFFTLQFLRKTKNSR